MNSIESSELYLSYQKVKAEEQELKDHKQDFPFNGARPSSKNVKRNI